MSPRFKFAVLQLTEQAQALIHRMLDDHKGPTAIASAVLARTGEPVTRFAVSRYAEHYRLRKRVAQQGRQQTEQLVQQAQQSGDEIPELLRAAFLEAFTQASMNGAIREMNPLHLESAERKRRELKLKEQQMLLAERRVEISEQHLQLTREKARAVLDQLDRKARAGESLSPEDVRRIREIYGIYDDSEPRENETESHDGNGPETADETGAR